MTDFRQLLDLASERFGGSVLFANDDFFAEKENLIKPSAAVWKEHEYTDRGKWMDGWESRRKRVPGHDYAIIRLGAPGVIRGVVVDTAFFRGNYPDSCSIEAIRAPQHATVEQLDTSTDWVEILTQSKLQGNSENAFEISSPFAFTHLRFRIFPDGGVARLRVYGEVVGDWRRYGGLGSDVDLAAAENGADVLACSDMFFGPKHNLIMPGRAANMSDGWETRRRRGPGHDWVIVKLALEGTIRWIELDTNHFKGNFPDTASLEGCNGDPESSEWVEVLPRTKMLAHTRHYFADELSARGPFTHLRLNVYPDGGVSRLRVHGRATERAIGHEAARLIDTTADPSQELMDCCASVEWVRQMAVARPFGSWERLAETAEDVWQYLDEAEWSSAFASHPRIGERRSAHQSASGNRWSAGEQSGMTDADARVRSELDEANRAYEERFGRTFIVCATGKQPEEMLSICRGRLGNDDATELRAAADEQLKITLLRLRKLVS